MPPLDPSRFPPLDDLHPVRHDGFDRFRRDERGVEGLPIRLVIAFVVGVASLSVMLNMVSGLAGLGVTELDTRPRPEVVTPGTHDVTVTVIDADGEPVADALVVVKSDTARLDGVATARTGPNGTATVTVSPTLAPNQDEGRLEIGVKPPAGGGYVDERGNAGVLVVRE
jgi:hypothetical protein